MTIRRDLLANGRASSTKTLWAQQWLDEIDQERSDALDAKREASQSEQTEIARSARDAAWSAADAAREAATAAREQALAAKTANTIATVALIAAIIAMAISEMDLYRVATRLSALGVEIDAIGEAIHEWEMRVLINRAKHTGG